jgi:peptidoglycan/xylan/chitin deacetylase (PgdA/CDA1 family)
VDATEVARIAWIALLALAFSTHAAAKIASPDRFDIAITVDDLPAHGALPEGMTRVGIARSYLATLKRHHVAEAFGFVNAAKVQAEPESEDVLAAWRQAGYPLGNHTFTHLNLDSAPSLAAWEADVIAGEPLVARYMHGHDWHYLRFPNLSAGNDPARHDAAAAFLAARGYRNADVSIAFDDWSYTDAYARCLARHDDATIAAMKAQYLADVDGGIVWMKAASHRIYGRMVPQVLLTHIGGWSAVMLPEVMKRLDAAGARYIPLAQAQRDPAYAEVDRVPGGGGIMERHANAANIDLSAIPRPHDRLGLGMLCR